MEISGDAEDQRFIVKFMAVKSSSRHSKLLTAFQSVQSLGSSRVVV